MKKFFGRLRYFCPVAAIIFMVVSLWLLFNGRELKIKENSSPFFSNNVNYYLSEVNLNFANSVSVTYPSIQVRPLTKWGYLKEMLKEKIVLADTSKHWQYLSSKKIGLLGRNGVDIILNLNYENPSQLEEWFVKSKPELFEFWKYDFFDTWEGGLGEYFFLIRNRIKIVSNSGRSKIWQIEEMVKLAAVVSEQKEYFDWIIQEGTSRDEKEKEYLIDTKIEVFDYIFDEIYSYIPVWKQGLYWYSFEELVKNRDEGVFDLWISTDWLKGGEKTDLALFYDDGNNKVSKDFNLTDRYGLKAGEIIVDSSRDGLYFSLYSPKFTEGIEKPPKVWLRKKSNLNGVVPNIEIVKISKGSNKLILSNYTADEERQLLAGKNFGWTIIDKKLITPKVVEVILKDLFPLVFFFLSLTFFCGWLLINISFKKIPNLNFQAINVFEKNLFFLRSKHLFFLIPSVFLIFVSGSNWDMLTVSLFIFWTVNVFVFNISSGYSFLLALLFILPSPVLILLKRVSASEITVVFSFIFILSGLLKQILENKENKNKSFQIDWKPYWVSTAKNLYLILLVACILFILFNFITDIQLYSDFFGRGYIKEILTRTWLKLMVVWLISIFVLFMVNRVFIRRFFGLFALTKNSRFQNRLSVIIFLLILSFFQNIIISSGRKTFVGKPYIFNISPSSARVGEEVKIIGKNFFKLNQETIGKVMLEGVQQKVIKWDNEEIIVEITDEFSDTGPMHIIVNKDKKIFESNKIGFTLIDFTKDWTEMEDL